MLTRPELPRVAAYRAHVDEAVERLIARADDAALAEVLRILEIGLNHEQQHQELLLTDILHAFAQNPLMPAYDAYWRAPQSQQKSAPGFVELTAGLHTVGHDGEGYSFDNEGPAHQVYLRPVRIGRGLDDALYAVILGEELDPDDAAELLGGWGDLVPRRR